MNVLIADHDARTAEALEQVLGVHGYTLLGAASGAEALSRLDDAALVLLDLDLPDLDGHEVCRRIRERSCVPVIALSTRSDELDRVMALRWGADDVVPKPFSRYELVARMEAVLRRTAACRHHTAGDGGPARTGPGPLPVPAPVPASTLSGALSAGQGPGDPVPAPLRAGPLELDLRTRKVLLHGDEVRVTRKEFDLLALLLHEPGRVRERREIMYRVWDENWFGSTRTLDVHVGSLRSKLGSNEWIETVRGVGYRITVPVRPLAQPAPG
ncbi:response regulator transcription factor [Streptomyces sp. JJ36]|nr:response regulator transcription factor [Streptomyces sp. JJ36]